jgi:hypothetical protein
MKLAKPKDVLIDEETKSEYHKQRHYDRYRSERIRDMKTNLSLAAIAKVDGTIISPKGPLKTNTVQISRLK